MQAIKQHKEKMRPPATPPVVLGSILISFFYMLLSNFHSTTY